MLQKTRGIVIHYLKFRESSIIAKIYTEELGIQSYIVNSVRSRKSKHNKIAFFQPLTLLDLVVYHRREREQLNRISEIKCAYPFQSIPFDVKKSGIAMFLAEIMQKALREESENTDLFTFIWESIIYLDQSPTAYENLHLYFLINLSTYLGFAPETGKEVFLQIEEHKNLLLDASVRKQFEEGMEMLIHLPREELSKIPTNLRAGLIDYLLDFYRLHVANFENIKSLGVLREINRSS